MYIYRKCLRCTRLNMMIDATHLTS
uniref:Uncharacterized protein n=1 Tax=Lepeophtheirus salmonis TaxID=72036 RepID=A0A0K2T6T9_LEPSM